MSIATLMPTREQGTLTNLIQGVVIGLFLTALSYAVGLGAGWIPSLSMLEVFAVFTSYVCTFLCVMERRINYPIGAISTAAYCLLFYQYGLVASTGINAFLTVYLVYGWLRWRADDNTLPVKKMNLPSWAIHILVSAIGYFIIVGIAHSLGGTLVWTDSVILAGTVLAQFMLDNKKFENWYVWAVVNVFAIYTYATAGLALVAFQYIFFLLNCFYGLYMWKKTVKDDGFSYTTLGNGTQVRYPIAPNGDPIYSEGEVVR